MRNIFGYLLGLCLFVLGIPALMWWVSGRGWNYVPESALQVIVAAILVAGGLALSIWSIVYMRRVGKGNPFDAYGHEVAPRTKNLMTDGPYGICRNPMLLGIYIFDAGVLIYLWASWPLVVFAVQVYFLTKQVRSEERRLEKDFGEEYLAYREQTRRLLPSSLPLPGRGNDWLGPRLRLLSIYVKLGYIPWRKRQKQVKERKGVYIGTREAIPFMNEDAKRTFMHLIFRPGYLMRDYILRGRHEYYLAPFTALLVFYSVMTLLLAVVKPGADKDSIGDILIQKSQQIEIVVDSSEVDTKITTWINAGVETVTDAILLTRLDLYPEAADTPWKESLAAIEGDVRSKGIPMFLGSFLLMWLSMALLLKKKYLISVSGAAAASAYVLCQFCIFRFLALLVTFGKTAKLGFLVAGALLFIDYRQWLGIGNKTALKLTVKTGLLVLAFRILFYVLIGGGLLLLVRSRLGA